MVFTYCHAIIKSRMDTPHGYTHRAQGESSAVQMLQRSIKVALGLAVVLWWGPVEAEWSPHCEGVRMGMSSRPVLQKSLEQLG